MVPVMTISEPDLSQVFEAPVMSDIRRRDMAMASCDIVAFMPIQAIEPRRLYLQIADQIRSMITVGEFPPGSRLPAERELAKRFGVSRPSMREALIALEVEGYVDVRPGSGILVTTPNGGARTVRMTRDRWKSCGLEA
jgi:DNA-binding transcriptional regulator YhcF (GntR family)